MSALLLPLAFAVVAQEGDMNFGEGDAPAADAPAAEAEPEEPAAPETALPTVEKSSLDEGIDLTLQDRIKAVSRKVFLKEGRFELDPGIAVTTNDPFFRTWSIAGRAAYHINDAFALEIGGAYVPPFFREQLPALDILREARFVNTDSELYGFADMGITFSPVYGKLAVLSDAIIHFDAYAIGGVGAVFDSNFAEDDPLHFVHPTMDIGAGLRVFMLRWLVVRADLRDYIYPQDRQQISTLQNLLVFQLSAGFYFPFDFEYRYEASRVRS